MNNSSWRLSAATHLLVFGLVSVLAVTGCTSEPAETPMVLPDSTVPVVAESIVATPPDVDTVVVADTVPAQDPVAVQLDSLRAEIARLTTAVATLRGVDTVSGSAGAQPDSATEAGGPAALEAAQQAIETAADATRFGVKIIWALVLIALTMVFVKAVVWVLDALSEQSATRRLFFKRLTPIIRLIAWSLTVYIVIAGIFEVDRQGLFAAATALGVAIGFASQDVLKNVFGGLLIVFDRPFQVGDKISVGGTYGEVVSIGLRATRIVTPDDNLVSVPNMEVVQGQVANANAGALDCQVVVDLYLPGWVDVMKAKAIAYDAAANSRYVYLDKPIVVIVKDEFKETFLTHLKVKAYVIDTRYEFAFASDVTEAAKTEFLKVGMLERFVPPAERAPAEYEASRA